MRSHAQLLEGSLPQTSPPRAQCRLRGKLDTNGVVGALLEERLNVGVNLLLSAEVRAPVHPSLHTLP